MSLLMKRSILRHAICYMHCGGQRLRGQNFDILVIIPIPHLYYRQKQLPWLSTMGHGISIYHNKKDGGMSILHRSFAKGKLYMFKNTQKFDNVRTPNLARKKVLHTKLI